MGPRSSPIGPGVGPHISSAAKEYTEKRNCNLYKMSRPIDACIGGVVALRDMRRRLPRQASTLGLVAVSWNPTPHTPVVVSYLLASPISGD